MTVIPFKSARSRRRPAGKVEPPSALGGFGGAVGPQQPDDIDYRLRTRQNLAAFAVVIVLVVFGAWLIDQLRTYSRIRACFEAGHRNCLPLNLEQPGAR